MSDNKVILHNYPQSPVAEKVRLGLGYKNLKWSSVLIPRVPPKPNLVALTGGYRRTPVMQIGADIYCDSQCILRELERRFPRPTFFPNYTQGVSWGISRWGEEVFNQSVKLVLGAAGEDLPEEFAKDRGRLYFGPDWHSELRKLNRNISGVVTQIRSHLSWIDERLAATSDDYIFGEKAGLADIELYYFIWFIRGRWNEGPAFLSQFKHLNAWESRIGAIGHGKISQMSAEDALSIASQSQPSEPLGFDSSDPQGLLPGMSISIIADVDGGETHTVGMISSVSKDVVSIMRYSDQLGDLCIHFPRVGYRIEII